MKFIGSKDYYGEEQTNTIRKEFDSRTKESRGRERNSSKYVEQIKDTRSTTKNDELSFNDQRQDGSNIKSNIEIDRNNQELSNKLVFMKTTNLQSTQ